MHDDFIDEIFDEVYSDPIASLKLPDPVLWNYYKDAENRIFYLNGDVDNKSLEIGKTILRINAEDEGIPPEERRPIYIYINSLGGDVPTACTLIGIMGLSKTPIVTIAFCNAMSAAAYLLVAGHKRYALPGSTIMVHAGSYYLNGDVGKVESAKKYYDSTAKGLATMLLDRSEITEKEFKKRAGDDWYMSAEDALRYKVVDAIVTDLSEITGGRA